MTSIRKAKKRADGDGSIARRKDGLLIVTVREDGKKRYLGSSRDPKVARKILSDYHDARKKGLRLDGWRLDDWLDYWLRDHMAPQYGPNGERISGVDVLTYQKYESAIRLYIKPFIGTLLPVSIVDVQAEHVERWLRALNRAGHSADTQTNALQRLSSALDLARRRKYVEFNVAGTDWITRPRLPTRQHVQPSENDLARLLAAIKGLPLEALVWIAMGGGFRRAEVAGLDWDDITFYGDDHAVIRAHRRRNRVGKVAQAHLGLDSGQLKREGLKTEAQRLVHVGGMVVQVLRQRWEAQVAERLLAGDSWKGLVYEADKPAGYLFTNSVGGPLEVDKISKFMTSVRESAGLDVKRFHGLRRAFTTLMTSAGVHDRVTMAQAGHKHLDMTHYYQDPMESQKREAAQALDAVLRRLTGEDTHES